MSLKHDGMKWWHHKMKWVVGVNKGYIPRTNGRARVPNSGSAPGQNPTGKTPKMHGTLFYVPGLFREGDKRVSGDRVYVVQDDGSLRRESEVRNG